MLKYKRFEKRGFERLRRSSERTKEQRLEMLWDLIGTKDITLWDYMVSVAIVYRGDDAAFQQLDFEAMKKVRRKSI